MPAQDAAPSLALVLITDDGHISRWLQARLEEDSYAVSVIDSRRRDLPHVVRALRPSAILLDAELRSRGAVEVVSELRRSQFEIGILMFSSRDSPADRVRALDAGADDYLGGLLSYDELSARLRALLRRTDAWHPWGPD
jgi:DNA-binding response OmpR family regulator